MKKFIKDIKTVATLLMAGAAFTACSSDDDIINEQPVNPVQQTYTMTIEASKGGATTRALSPDGTTLNATWTENDEVKVFEGSTLLGTLKAKDLKDGGASCTLRGNLDVAPSASGVTLTLKFNSDDNSGQDGTLNYIASHCDYATATTTATVSGSTITGTAANFTNQQAIVKFTLKNKTTDAAISASMLVVSDGIHNYTVKPASTTNVIYVAMPGITNQTVSLNATVGSSIYTYEKASSTFGNGQYYEISVKMKPGGKFTVDGSSTQVYFSRGNLQYKDNETYKWRFAENQYDYVGAWNTSTWVDLFCWGTWTGSSPNPTNTSTTNTDYSWDAADFVQESLLADASLRSYDWRTVSKDEWVYLFNTRTSGLRYAKATVNSVSGVILLPDDWKTSYHSLASTNTAGAAYTANSFTSAEWTNDFESHGCVFLPVAGRRYGTTISLLTEKWGFYWSSTVNGTEKAHDMYFATDNLNPQYNFDRRYGYSVRLVRVAE